MNDDQLHQCSKECMSSAKGCSETSCRMWVDYDKDNNCSIIYINQNGTMTMEEVSKRMKDCQVQVSQVEKEEIKKH